MDSPTLVGIISTVLPFATFIGIVVWAWSRKRRVMFNEAANAPFALPDDDRPTPHSDGRHGTAR